MLKLTKELRTICAKPHGELYAGNYVKISDIREISECKIIVCVGDIVSLNAIKTGVKPDIILIDDKTRREGSDTWSEIKEFCEEYVRFDAFNPAGHITSDLAEKILKAKEFVESKKKVMIYVDGEEDLSVIPLVCILPENSLIIYGQPDEGVVALKVTYDKKLLIHDILEKMEKVNGNGNEVYDICRIEKQ